MIILSDYLKEENIDFLNNAKNSLLDNFGPIKCLFHQVIDLKDGIISHEGRIYSHKYPRS